MEYPLRPPLFTLNLFRAASAETESEVEANEWFNELRAMEAEVRKFLFGYSVHESDFFG